MGDTPASQESSGIFFRESGDELRLYANTITSDHVPYRNSKLTRMLQPSLSGNARISVVCTINPDAGAGVHLNAQKREVVDTDALIECYRKEIEDLKKRLEEREREATCDAPSLRTRSLRCRVRGARRRRGGTPREKQQFMIEWSPVCMSIDLAGKLGAQPSLLEEEWDALAMGEVSFDEVVHGAGKGSFAGKTASPSPRRRI
ncbi:hypothetical protein C8J57DRAFT_1214494 [Mycena rebaudengoi]|nr:hypothetical protein C8J57DRAFT_1214494 [Mycena rebaudengoi]